jgi:Niemann-Pick C1 protein
MDLMCGPWGSYSCTPKRWFDFMGETKDSLYVPFKINYMPHTSPNMTDGFTPLDPKTVPCYEKLDVSYDQ